jgi:hypothetical protein
MRTLGALFLACVAVFGQSSDKECSVDGSVVNSVTRAPIARAHVSVSGAQDGATADSDAAGKWSIRKVACGRVTVMVTRVGFLVGSPSGSPAISLVPETPLHDLALELTPQSVISGRVVDDQGDPVPNAQIGLMTSRIANGVRGLLTRSSTVSNDLGDYRFAGLPAGKYSLCANFGNPGVVVANQSRLYAEKCYPGPVNVAAPATMDLGPGNEMRVDFALDQVATVSVSGVVTGKPDGVNASVGAVPQFGKSPWGVSAPVLPDGSFHLKNVPPGSYILRAYSAQEVGRLSARAPLDVGNTDVTGIQLHLEPGVTITGAVKILSTGATKIEKPQYSLLFTSTDGNPGAQAVWDENKTSFTVADAVPGKYLLNFSAPAPLYLKSVSIGGRPVANSEVTISAGAESIELTLSDDAGSVEGDVSTDDGPVAAWILLQRDGSPPRNARSDANGHFRIDTVRPGDYVVSAWSDLANVEYANPEWMRSWAKTTAISVQPGRAAQIHLTRQLAPVE